MKTIKYNFKAYEKQAVKEFRELYPDWNNVKNKDLQICDDGTIYFGSIEFKIKSNLYDFEKK
jgi:hypothetical protein